MYVPEIFTIEMMFVGQQEPLMLEVTEQQFRRLKNMYHDVSQSREKELPKQLKIKNNYYNTALIESVRFNQKKAK